MAVADIVVDEEGNTVWIVNPAISGSGSSSETSPKAWIVGIVAVLAVLAAAKIAKG